MKLVFKVTKQINGKSCEDFKKDLLARITESAVEADAESRCPKCGETEPVLHCEKCGHNWCRTA